MLAIMFIGTNGFSGALVGIGVAVIVHGRTVQIPGNDSTIFYKTYRRTASAWWCACAMVSVGLFFGIFQGGGVAAFLMFVMAVAFGAAAHVAGGGKLPFLDDEDENLPASTPEDRAYYSIGEHLFEESGLTVKSSETGLPLRPEIISRGVDSKGRVWLEARVVRGQQTVEDVAARSGRIASEWDVPRVAVTEPRPHVARITAIIQETRLVGPVEWKAQPVARDVVEYVSSLNLGAYVEDGEPFVMNLKERNFVLGGQPGSGKSSFTNALLAHLAQHPDIRIAFVDLKQGVEAAPWAPRADQIIEADDEGDDADDDFGDDLDALDSLDEPTSGQLNLGRFLAGAISDMNRRYSRMKKAGVTNAWDEKFLGPSEPLKVIVIDEIADAFVSDSKQRAAMSDKIVTALKMVIQKGRAAGYVLLMATQYPKEENLPNSIRQNVSNAVAFRVRDDSGSMAILGRNYAATSRATDPAQITGSERGQAVIVDESGAAQRIQCSWLDKATKQRVVATSARLKRQWLDRPPKKRPAMEPAPARPAKTEQDSVQEEVDALLDGLDLDSD